MSVTLTQQYEELYRENYLKVYRLALGLAGNTDDAEEITQEAFFRAFRSFDSFRKESSFFTWVYRITLNVANDYMRQRAKMPVYSLTEDLGYSLGEILDENPSNDPETEVLSREARYMCLHCLTECLPLEQRKIFCLAITIGLSYKMVAEILECSLSKVKTTIHRSKQRWFGYMENRCALIKKSNPCHCNQWVHFALEKGWISKQEKANLRPEIDLKTRDEIMELRTLRDIYQQLYQVKIEESLVERIREGIAKKEWSIIS